MWKLKTLKLKNFRSWRELVLDDIDTLGLVLINGANGIGKCVDEDSYIYQDSILSKITTLDKDWNFVGFKKSNNIITTSNGINVPTSDIYSDIVSELISIKTNTGYRISGTPSHKILILDPDLNFKFRQLKDISKDDYICIDRRQNKFTKNYKKIIYSKPLIKKGVHNQINFTIPELFNEDLSRLLGYYIANGSYNNYKKRERSERISISTVNLKLINDIKYICNKYNITIKQYTDDTLSIGGVEFARFLNYLLDGNTGTARFKKIPNIILESPKICQANFLKALFDCDGYFNKNKSVIEFYTASVEIAKVVHLLLLNFGIVSKWSTKNSATVNGKIYNHQYHTISISSKDTDIYFEEIGSLYYKHIYKKRNTNKDIIPYLKNIIYNELSRVKSILNVDASGRYYIDGYKKVFINTAKIKSEALNLTYEKLSDFLSHVFTKHSNLLNVFDKDLIRKCNIIINSRFYYDTVKEKEINYKTNTRVYDVSVPNYHTFYSNGFINHNSSIRQAIEYLLLDTISDGYKVEDIPFNKKGDCELYCKILNGGDVVEITKYRDHKQFGNKIILSINENTDLTSTDRRVTQKEIEKLLGITNNEVFISTIFTTTSPSFPAAKDSERKDVLYNARNLNKYKEYQDKAKAKVSEVESSLQDNSVELKYLEVELRNTSKYIDALQEKISSFDQEKKVRVAKKIIERNQNADKDTYVLEQEIKELNEINLDSQIDNISKYNHIIQELQNEKNKVDLELKLNQKELLKIKDGVCPIIGTKCNTLIEEKDKIESKAIPYSFILTEKALKLTNQIEKNQEHLKEYKKIDLQNEQLRNKLIDLKNRLKSVNDYNLSIDKIKAKYDKDIEEITKETNPYIELQESEQKKIGVLNSSIEETKKTIKEREELLKYYKFWVRGFGKEGIPNLKMEAFLEQIEQETNLILSDIADRLFVKIESQSALSSGEVRERISYDVVSTDKNITDYASYSGGQKQRVKVADISAFNKLLGKFNFIILDEVLELSLDEKGKGQILELLKRKYLSGEIQTIFVISHDTQIKDHFDKIINIGIKDGVSYIKGGEL